MFGKKAPDPLPHSEFEDKRDFFAQLLPEEATKEEIALFRRLVSKITLRLDHEEEYMKFFKQRWPRRVFDDLWTLKNIERKLESQHNNLNAKYLPDDWVYLGNHKDTLWRVEFLKGQAKIQTPRGNKEDSIPRSITQAVQIIDRTLEEKPPVTSERINRIRDKLREEREKITKKYGMR